MIQLLRLWQVVLYKIMVVLVTQHVKLLPNYRDRNYTVISKACVYSLSLIYTLFLK